MRLALIGCALAALAVVGGCGSKETTYFVNGHSLTVRDSGYVTTTLRYCEGAAAGQMRLSIVDYNPICGGPIPASADGGARDARLEHNELEFVFVTSSHDDPKLPYEVSPPNCDVGPAGPGIARFKHYASGATTAEEIIGQSGELFLTTLDPADLKPATGRFSVDFGGSGKVEGTFEAYTCN